MAKMQANFQEISCGLDFADWKRPSYPLKKTQPHPCFFSQERLSLKLSYPWSFSIDSDRSV